MEKLARSYIEKRVQQTRTGGCDYIARLASQGSEKTRAELARHEAQKGFTATTASHLRCDNTLSVSQKGEILAEAYKRSAERSAMLANYSVV